MGLNWALANAFLPKASQIKCKLCCLIDLWLSASLYCTHISKERGKTEAERARGAEHLSSLQTFQLSLN